MIIDTQEVCSIDRLTRIVFLSIYDFKKYVYTYIFKILKFSNPIKGSYHRIIIKLQGRNECKKKGKKRQNKVAQQLKRLKDVERGKERQDDLGSINAVERSIAVKAVLDAC